MPLTKNWSIEEVLLKTGIRFIRRREVTLLVVCETRQETDISDGDNQDSPTDQNQRHGTAYDEDKVVEEFVDR